MAISATNKESFDQKLYTGSHIYHVKTTVSDLKDQDFAIAALEMKTKQLKTELSQIQKHNYWYQISLLIPVLHTSFPGPLQTIHLFHSPLLLVENCNGQ